MFLFPLLNIDPPYVTPSNTSIQLLNQGSNLTLNCNFVGQPHPLLKWLNNGVVLQSMDTITITTTYSLINHTSTLQWVSVPGGSSGTIACVATNYLGSSKITVSIKIYSKLLPSQFLHLVVDYCEYVSSLSNVYH